MSQNNIILHVDNVYTHVEGHIHTDVYAELRKVLGYRDQEAFWKKRKTRSNWDGWITTLHYSKRNGMYFPSGVLGIAKDFFSNYNISYTIIDERENVENNLHLSLNKSNFETRPYQVETIKTAVKKQRGLINMATGGGKTLCAAGIIAEIGVSPFIFYVPSIDLLKQAKDELERFLLCNGSSMTVGVLGGGEHQIRDINVMTVQTAVRALGEEYEKLDDESEYSDDEKDLDQASYRDICELIKLAKGFIGDECHCWRSKSALAISKNSISAKYRWGLSATSTRNEGDDILIYSCFGRKIVDINASYLIEREYLVKPDVFFVPINNMNGSHYSSYQKIYKSAIVENSFRNQRIADIAKAYKDNGSVVLILCKYIAHGNILAELIDGSVFLHGEHSGVMRKAHLDAMRKREASITIASSIFDEGIDVKPLDTLILAGSGKSPTRALQRVGRILRPYPGKDHATVIDFDDKCKYMHQHSKKRLAMYKTEPEFNIQFLKEKNA